MKKKILSGAALLAIAAGAVFNVSLNSPSDNLSALMLANMEALADNESGGVNIRNCEMSSNVYSDSSASTDYTICNSSTTSSTIYPCGSKRTGRKYVSSNYNCIVN